jgi:protein-disulfide isomerase
MKLFYGGLGAIAIAGAMAIWMATRSGGPPPVQILDQPLSLSTAAFPGYVIGSDSAPVEIVQYADFTCSHCATFTILNGPTIIERLVQTGRARLRFRGLALYQISFVPLNAAACAGEQGKFWEMHDQLMFNQNAWLSDPDGLSPRRLTRTFRDYARAVGVDMGRYDACVEEGRYNERILATREEILNSGITSTPTFEIGRYRFGAVSYDSLTSLVEIVAGQER